MPEKDQFLQVFCHLSTKCSLIRTTLFWWHGSVRGRELLVKGGAGLEVDCKAA